MTAPTSSPSKVLSLNKAFLHRAAARTQAAFKAAIAAGLATLTPQGACDWFNHCG